MNPFKIKAFEEFTIADCEMYLNCYPYGEHSVEVKEKLRHLKKTAHGTMPQQSVSVNNISESIRLAEQNSDKEINKKHFIPKDNFKSVTEDGRPNKKLGKGDFILRFVGFLVIVIGLFSFFCVETFSARSVIAFVCYIIIRFINNLLSDK